MSFNPTEHFRKVSGNQDYLEVKWRLVWLREECKDWTISTELISHDTETHTAVFKASIYDSNSKLIATAHGSECIRDFKDYLEKAETKAIGRATALCGFGTQFAAELDEEERIVDAPVERKSKPDPKPKQEQPKKAEYAKPKMVCECCGKPILEVVIGDTRYSPEAVVKTTLKNMSKKACYECYMKSKGDN